MPKNSIFRFDGAKVLTIPTRAELFLKKCYVCVHILNISQDNTAYCTKKTAPRCGSAALILFADSRRLESELVTQSEHEHTVVALLVTIVILKCVCQTPVVTSVEHEVSILVRKTDGN